MWQAEVTAAWQHDGEYYGELRELLTDGDSMSQYVGQQPSQLLPDPNVSSWLVVCTGTTLDAIDADSRFTVVWSEEVVEDAV